MNAVRAKFNRLPYKFVDYRRRIEERPLDPRAPLHFAASLRTWANLVNDSIKSRDYMIND